MADTLIRLNSVHALAVVNPAGLPEEGVSGESTHLSLDDFGNLRVSGAAGAIAANVAITNGAGALAVNIQDGGNSITVDGTVTTTSAPRAPGTEVFEAATMAALKALVDAFIAANPGIEDINVSLAYKPAGTPAAFLTYTL